MNQPIEISPTEAFQTIAEAALLAPLPTAFKNRLQSQIIAFQKYLMNNEREAQAQQLELELASQEEECSISK